MKNKIHQVITHSALAMLLFVACETPAPNYLLRCSFESDPLWGVPSKSLPGDPAGDELNYAAETEITVMPTDVLSEYQSINLPNLESIEFISRYGSFASARRFYWAGKLDEHYENNNGHGGFKEIEITDGNGAKLVQFIIFGTHVIVKFKNDDVYGYEGRDLGSLFPQDDSPFQQPNPNTQHIFIIDVKYGKRMFDLTLVGPDLVQTLFKETNIPLYDTDVQLIKSTRPTLKITNSSGCCYRLDEVTIQ